MKNGKRIGCMLLALLMAASFWGCASSQQPDGTMSDTTQSAPETTAQPETTQAPETTVPEVTADNPIGLPSVDTKPAESDEALASEQLRLHSVTGGWKSKFNQAGGCFAVAASVEELAALTEGYDVDVSAYDAAFFTENRLVLIPRSSKSGSIRYSAYAQRENGNVNITLNGEMPEMGTADMAEWLVLVVLPYSVYDAALTVTSPAPADSGSSTGVPA